FLSLDAMSEEIQTLEKVVVEDYKVNPPLNFPSAFSTTINLDDFSGEYSTSSELLNLSPGVNVRDFGGFGQFKTISIRGSSDDQVVVLLDGIRLNNPLSGGVDLSTIPINYVDEFEIIRGGASALAGSDAIGGVINIKTKSFKERFTSSSATYGSFNTLSVNLSRADKIGNFGYLFSFNYSKSDGDFDFESINDLRLKRINNEFDAFSFLTKFGYEINDWEISFLNEFFYNDKGVPGLGEFQEANSNQKDLRNLTNIQIKKEGFIKESFDFESNLFHRLDKFKFDNPNPLVGIPIGTDSNLFSFGANSKLTLYAPKENVATFAAELKFDLLKNSDFNDPGRTNLSFFAGDEIYLFNNRLLINPISRFDLFWTSDDNGSSTDVTFSPKLGSIFYLSERFLLKGNLSYSNRVPNFSELFLPDQGFIGGNTDLHNEESFDFDLGIAFLHPKISFELNYFRALVDDTILFVFINAQRIEPRNIGEVTQQGIESLLILKPLSFFELFAAYTFLDGEVEDTGAQLPGRPKNKLDLRGVLKYRNFETFWETKFVDEIPLTPFPDSTSTDSRTTHDIGVKTAWKSYFATIEIKNLFNNLNVRDALDFPLPGRTLFFTAGVKF
ncbi:MAG: TonB-dependent receptor plug domain-containing protein, partial [Thermodesulfobacteriota bacterium]